jgi:sugar phosphate isomerase/epimerase
VDERNATRERGEGRGRVEPRCAHLRGLRFGAYEDVPNGKGAVDFEAVVDTASAAGVEWFVYENEMDQDPTAKIADATAFLDGLLGDRHRPRSESAVRADGC